MTPRASKPIISLFIHCYPPARGGAEYLAKQFVRVLDKKFIVHVFTGQGETLDSYKTFDHYLPPETNPCIHRLPVLYWPQKLANKFLNKIIFKVGLFSPYYFGPHLRYTQTESNIISQSQYIIGIAMPTKCFFDSYCFAKKFHQKLILIPAYHNVSYYNHNPLFQRAFNYAYKIFYLTPFEKNELCKNYQINDSKLVQTTFCPYNKSSVIARHQNQKTLTIGFIGQITLRKNLGIFADYLLKYQDYWTQKGIKLRVYLAGAKTNSSPQVEKPFSKCQTSSTFVYDFPEDTKPAHYREIDIFINPSQEESLGIVNFEALYHGCRLIIHQNSAFSSIDNSIPSFFTIDNLHQQILNLYSHPISPSSIFSKYSLDRFRQTVSNSFSQAP